MPDRIQEKHKTISWTVPMLEQFKQRYDKAVAGNELSFVYDDNEFVTGYAKYLIEYLDEQFSHSQG